jgi:hypothetical protein
MRDVSEHYRALDKIVSGNLQSGDAKDQCKEVLLNVEKTVVNC